MDNQKREGDYWSIFMMYNEYGKLIGSPRNVKKKKKTEGREKNIVILLLMQETRFEYKAELSLWNLGACIAGDIPQHRDESPG